MFIKSYLGNYIYELVEGNHKLVESFKPCGGFSNTACATGCKNHDNACAFFEAKKPDWYRTWPPCIGDTAVVANTLCGASGCSEPKIHRCNEGTIVSKGIYWSFWPAGPYVTRRSLYRWICNTCVDEYDAKLTECGDGEIIAWDNEECTGRCDDGCREEYDRLVEECGAAENVVFFPETCSGWCGPKNAGPPDCTGE